MLPSMFKSSYQNNKTSIHVTQLELAEAVNISRIQVVPLYREGVFKGFLRFDYEKPVFQTEKILLLTEALLGIMGGGSSCCAALSEGTGDRSFPAA